MSGEYKFSESDILGDGLGKLNRRELLALARDVCRALAGGGGQLHGNIHPNNISRKANGEVGVGPRAAHSPGDWSPDELEYMAPELFWDHTGTPTADVYSVGMLLLSGACGGRLPFFPAGVESPDADQRAAALRRRLSGDEIALPPELGERMSNIIERCLAYQQEERYQSPSKLLKALKACPDSEGPMFAAVPPVIPIMGPEPEPEDIDELLPEPEPAPEAPPEPEVIAEPEPEIIQEPEPEIMPEAEPEPEPEIPDIDFEPIIIPGIADEPEEAPTVHDEPPQYKVDKQFESRDNAKKGKKPFIIIGAICAAAIILGVSIYAANGGFSGPKTSPTPTPTDTDAVVGQATDSPKPTETAEPSGTMEPTTVPTTDPSAEPSPADTGVPVVAITPKPTVKPTAAPTPTPTSKPTATAKPTAAPPAATPTPTEEQHRYELYIEDLSWTEAAEKCEELGGHLVTISDAAELKAVTDLAESKGVSLVWIGFYRDANGQIVWVNDEDIDYYKWGKGEPSGTDTDGTAEGYGLLWHWGPRTGWIYNDSRNDPAVDFPDAYSGKIAYICEFD